MTGGGMVRAGFGIEDNFRLPLPVVGGAGVTWPDARMVGTERACACCEPHIYHPGLGALCGTCQRREARCCLVERGRFGGQDESEWDRLTGVEAAAWGLVEVGSALVELGGLEDDPGAAAGLLRALWAVLVGIADRKFGEVHSDG